MKVMLTHRSTVDRVGGVATFIFELADAFIRMGHEVSVLTFSSSINAESVKRIYHVENVPRIISLKRFEQPDYWPPRGSSLKDLSIWLVRGSKVIIKEKPDLVIINGIVPLIKSPNTTYVAVVHQICPHLTDLSSISLMGLRILYDTIPDFIVAITNREKRCLIEYLGIESIVIPLCINTRKYKISKLEEREKIILHVGVFGPKNLETTLKVFTSICSKDKSVKLYIVGGYDDNHMKLFRNIVKDDDCKNRVTFTGLISKERLIGLYSKSRILIAPSFYEGFPYVSLEAQASGTPVVVSNAIPPEAVIDGVTGFRIPDPKDVCSFREKVLALLEDDILYEEMSKNARKHAEKLDCIVIAKKYLEVLKKHEANLDAIHSMIDAKL
jgi:glycosyltransferase involved in cell wall biosynthesis